MSDIFISYKREEQATARKLANALEREGWSVWWDPKLRAGERFNNVIEKALKEAKCVIVLWSELSVQSEYVQDEAAEALEQKKLVPVKIENVVPPMIFKRVHTLSLLAWDGSKDSSEFRKLVEDISAILGQSPMAVGAAEEQRRLEAEADERRKLEKEHLREQERQRAEEEARQKAEEENRRRIKEERNRSQQEAEQRRLEAEARREAEEERLQEQERQLAEEETKRKAEEDRRRIKAEAQRKLEEERLREQERQRSKEQAREKTEEENRRPIEQEEADFTRLREKQEQTEPTSLVRSATPQSKETISEFLKRAMLSHTEPLALAIAAGSMLIFVSAIMPEQLGIDMFHLQGTLRIAQNRLIVIVLCSGILPIGFLIESLIERLREPARWASTYFWSSLLVLVLSLPLLGFQKFYLLDIFGIHDVITSYSTLDAKEALTGLMAYAGILSAIALLMEGISRRCGALSILTPGFVALLPFVFIGARGNGHQFTWAYWLLMAACTASVSVLNYQLRRRKNPQSNHWTTFLPRAWRRQR